MDRYCNYREVFLYANSNKLEKSGIMFYNRAKADHGRFHQWKTLIQFGTNDGYKNIISKDNPNFYNVKYRLSK